MYTDIRVLLLLLLLLLMTTLAYNRPLRVMVACGWHGREWATVELCKDWKNLQSSQEQRRVEWHFIESLNPSGVGAAGSGHNPCQRVNARGVDLNRNFPPLTACPDNETLPVRRGGEGVTLKPWDETYPGPEPLSEQETRDFVAQVLWFRPDVLLLVHTGEELIALPYDSCWSTDHEVLYERQLYLGRAMAQAVGIEENKVWPGLTVLYPAVGTATDYARQALNVPFVYTLETYKTTDHQQQQQLASRALSPEQCRDVFTPTDMPAYLARWRKMFDLFNNNNGVLDASEIVNWSEEEQQRKTF